ncbi:hypothetical protein [Campylobacter sp. RM16190]|uniref:hypothetical protein n=1 Tax=Campylobacter sp. RM16190 TaxID=1705727 RepID=UPI0014748855|nr:hypothetical protein [Campylobacter sp. RM16190]
MDIIMEVFILLTFYSFLWAFFFYCFLNLRVHVALKILIIIPIFLFVWWLEAAMVFTMLPALILIYKIKPKIHIIFVLINLALIGYLYYHNAINLYKFQKMCKNKEYYIEIVDNNYSIEDIRNQKYKFKITKNVEECKKDRDKCPNTTMLVHDRDVYSYDETKLIARTYNVFMPYDNLNIKVSTLSHTFHGKYCEAKDTNKLLLEKFLIKE